MKNILKIFFLLLMFVPFISIAQNAKKLIREGNSSYENKNYDESELKYRKSIDIDKNSSVGLFNLGDALYKQEKFEEAEDKFRQALSLEQAKEKKQVEEAKIYHNLGNSLLKQEKYEESINAYKNSLKRNPNDVDTKYNLSYAQKMLRHQQQNQQNQDQQQNKDQQKQDQQQEQDQQKQQQQQNAEQNEQRKEHKEGEQLKPRNLSKEEAEKMLDALRNDEKDLQKKIKRAEPIRGTTEKNW